MGLALLTLSGGFPQEMCVYIPVPQMDNHYCWWPHIKWATDFNWPAILGWFTVSVLSVTGSVLTSTDKMW